MTVENSYQEIRGVVNDPGESVTFKQKKTLIWDDITNQASKIGGLEEIENLIISGREERKSRHLLSDDESLKIERSLRGKLQAIERRAVFDEIEETNSPWKKVLGVLSEKTELNTGSGFVKNYLAAEIISLRKELGRAFYDRFNGDVGLITNHGKRLVDSTEECLGKMIIEYIEEGGIEGRKKIGLRGLAEESISSYLGEEENNPSRNIFVDLVQEAISGDETRKREQEQKVRKNAGDTLEVQRQKELFFESRRKFVKKVPVVAAGALLGFYAGGLIDTLAKRCDPTDSPVRSLGDESNINSENYLSEEAKTVSSTRSGIKKVHDQNIKSEDFKAANPVNVETGNGFKPAGNEEEKRYFGFEVGGINFEEPFQLVVPGEVSSDSGYPKGVEINIEPLVNRSKTNWPKNIVEIFSRYWENKGAALVTQTDIPGHIVGIIHSFRYKGEPLPGEIFRAYRDRDKLKNRQLEMVNGTGKKHSLKIVDVSELDPGIFERSDAVVSGDETERCLFFRTDRSEDDLGNKYGLGLPAVARKSNQITFITCDGRRVEDNGLTSFSKRLLITAEFVSSSDENDPLKE